jgi:protein-S-isoprenylcysteine O-methyltransferase Ste14
MNPSGPIVDELAATGDVLFRWRSYMPLVLVPLFILSVSDDRPPTPFTWELICFLVALSGLFLRAYIIGTAPAGASTRGTRQPTADSLSTLGAYSIVRHPLYLANTLVALGCSMLSGTWYLPLIIILLSFIYHERIAAREEAFLQSAFGDSFHAWVRNVPAMIPAFRRYRPAGIPFQMRRVIMQESHGLCAIGTAFLVLDTLEDSVRAQTFYIDPRWLAIFMATALPFLIVVITKKSARRSVAAAFAKATASLAKAKRRRATGEGAPPFDNGSGRPEQRRGTQAKRRL